MGDTPLTTHDAERIRREWAAGRADLDDITRALDQLVHALGTIDKAKRVLAELLGGPWPAVKKALAGIDAWLAEAEPPIKKPAEGMRW